MLRHLAEWYESDRTTNQAFGLTFPFVRSAIQAGSAPIPGWFGSAQLLARAIAIGQNRGDIRADLDPGVAGALVLDGYLGVLTDGPPPNYRRSRSCPTWRGCSTLFSLLAGLVNEPRD